MRSTLVKSIQAYVKRCDEVLSYTTTGIRLEVTHSGVKYKGPVSGEMRVLSWFQLPYKEIHKIERDMTGWKQLTIDVPRAAPASQSRGQD
jgi:hypothetical protein